MLRFSAVLWKRSGSFRGNGQQVPNNAQWPIFGIEHGSRGNTQENSPLNIVPWGSFLPGQQRCLPGIGVRVIDEGGGEGSAFRWDGGTSWDRLPSRRDQRPPQTPHFRGTQRSTFWLQNAAKKVCNQKTVIDSINSCKYQIPANIDD